MIDLLKCSELEFVKFFQKKISISEIIGNERWSIFKDFVQHPLPNPQAVSGTNKIVFNSLTSDDNSLMRHFEEDNFFEELTRDVLIALIGRKTNGSFRLFEFDFDDSTAFNSFAKMPVKKIPAKVLKISKKGEVSDSLNIHIIFSFLKIKEGDCNILPLHRMSIRIVKSLSQLFHRKSNYKKIDLNIFDKNINDKMERLFSK